MIKMATNPRIKAAILNVQQQCEAAGFNLTKSVAYLFSWVLRPLLNPVQHAFEIFGNLKGRDQ